MTKFLASIITLMVLCLMITPVFAACDPSGQAVPNTNDPNDPLGTITRPCELDGIEPGAVGIGQVFGNLFRIVYSVAGILFLIMFIWGAISWIISSGNKESLASAQKRIKNAIIGIVLLAFTAPIAFIIGKLVGIDIFRP